MKKYWIVIFYLIILFIPFMAGFFEEFEEGEIDNPFDYARITDIDYKAVVVDEPGSYGKVIITEKLTYDIHAASQNNPFWELWRDLPEEYIDGVKTSYKVNSVKQILDNGEEIVYEESPKLYWDDSDYTSSFYGPGKWYYSPGPYSESLRQYECVMFYIDGVYRDKLQFEIEYEMQNAALRYNDCSELYLSCYSDDSIKYLKSFKGEILFPNDIMPGKSSYDAYTLGTNADTFPFTESANKNPGYYTFSFDLDENDLQFKPYNQYIEFLLLSYGPDKHIFTKYASINNYYNEDALGDCMMEIEKYQKASVKAKSDKAALFILLFILTIIAVTSYIRTLKRIKNKNVFYKPETEFEYFRDIPSDLDPRFAAALVFCKENSTKYKKDEYSAIMLSLVRKGYVELAKISPEKDWNFNNIKIIIKYIAPSLPTDTPQPEINTEITTESQPISETISIEHSETLEPLTLSEKLYFNLIVKHASKKSIPTEISMKDFQTSVSLDYDNTDTFVRNMDSVIVDVGVGERYFQRADYNKPKNQMAGKAIRHLIYAILLLLVNIITSKTRIEFAFGGFFLLAAGYLFSAYKHKKISTQGILLTEFGENEYSKWRGLYNFLNSETLMNERTVIELPIWEKYLVYATAFGISEKVIKAIKIRCPEVQNSVILNNSYYRSTSFHHHHHSIRSSAHSASFTSRSGGYGGYGGGGRGGRRRWRWSLKLKEHVKKHALFYTK